MKKVDENEICPCGSQKTYGQCCWNKDFEFHINDSGEINKAIRINNEFKEYVDEQLQTYREIFNRDPLPEEPIYLWSLVYSDEDYDDNIEEHLIREGFDASFIYAHKKTRLTVNEERKGLFTTEELFEWDQAIKEYENGLKSKDEPIRKIHKIQYYLEQLDFHIEQLLYQYHLLMHHQNQNLSQINFKDKIAPKNLLNFIITKNLKTIKAILKLHEAGFGTDCLNLIRSQLENYKELIGLKYSEQEFIRVATARIGLKWGTHEYCKNSNGKTDFRRIVEKLSGETTKLQGGHVTMENSPYDEDIVIYQKLQDLFSTFVHTDATSVSHFLDDQLEEFSSLKRSFKLEIPYYLMLINTLIVSELINSDYISKRSSLDLQVLIDRVVPIFKLLFEATSKHPEFSEIIANEEMSRILRIKHC